MSAPGPAPSADTRVCYRHPDRPANIACQRCGRLICPACMNDAAVGFQCPSCVAEGRKTTRQARTSMGGAVARTTAPIATYVILGINVAVWLAVTATGRGGSRLVDVLGLRSVGVCTDGRFVLTNVHSSGSCSRTGFDWLPGVADGAYWQLITSQFLHVEIWHIAGNMLTLWVLGTQLEPLLGRVRFVALYLIAGLTGSAAVYLFSAPEQLTLGASGAIYGLFAAFVIIALRMKADLRSILGVLAINVFITFAIPNVSWQGHLGGFVGGLAVTAAIAYAPRGPRQRPLQWTAMAGVVAVALIIFAVRTLSLT